MVMAAEVRAALVVWQRAVAARPQSRAASRRAEAGPSSATTATASPRAAQTALMVVATVLLAR